MRLRPSRSSIGHIGSSAKRVGVRRTVIASISRVEITFEDEGGKTLMKVIHSGLPDESNRDFFADVAWKGFFDRLEAYFAAKVGG